MASQHDGKRVFRLVDLNPRAEGSKAHACWELIEDGMLYEEYIEAGGTYYILKLEIDYGRVELRFEEPYK